MRVTIRTPETSLSDEECARLARSLGLALAPYRPRVVRAALLLGDGGAPDGGRARVAITVPLGPAGVVRVQSSGSDRASASREGIRRTARAVAARLQAEREQLLEFLFVASVAAPERGARPGGARARRAPPRRSGGPDHASGVDRAA